MPDAHLADLIKITVERLKVDLGDDGTREREASLLIEAATGLDRLAQIGDPKAIVGAKQTALLNGMIERRLAGESAFRIIGRRHFYGLNLEISSGTLEPRDDTEILVDAVLNHISDKDASPMIADLGTGTGAIGLALANALPNALVTLTDISAAALETAQRNAVSNGLSDRVSFLRGEWCEPLTDFYDVIVSNPPYIASDVIASLAREVRDHDPRGALDGGADGLDAYRAILDCASHHLRETGLLALEIGYDQAEAVRALAAEKWRFLSLTQDLGGRDRVLLFQPR